MDRTHLHVALSYGAISPKEMFAYLSRPSPSPSLPHQHLRFVKRDYQGRSSLGLLEACRANNVVLRNSTRPEIKPDVIRAAGEDDEPFSASAAQKKTKKHKGGASAGKQGAPKKQKMGGGSTSNAVVAVASATEEGQQLYCICKSPWDETSDIMIGCEGGCDGWFHLECLGYKKTIEKKTKDVCIIDLDGSRRDTSSTEFHCPWCELTSGRALPAAQRFFGDRLSAWCDAFDVLAEEQPPQPRVVGGINHPMSSTEQMYTRWKFLINARNSVKQIAQCSSCLKRHHPFLPCPRRKSSFFQTILEKSTLTEVWGEFPADKIVPLKLSAVNSSDVVYGLVLAGRYQGFRGRVVMSSKRWAHLALDDDVTLIYGLNSNLLVSKGLSFAADDEFNSLDKLRGVRRVEGEKPAYDSFLDMNDEEGNELVVYLGRFASKIRAARAHDLCSRLQFGEEDGDPHRLNFPDPVGPKDGDHSQLWETAWNLSSLAYFGPFQSSNAAGPHLDPLVVFDWCENIRTDLDEVPPYDGARAAKSIERLLQALIPVASEAGRKLRKKLDGMAFATSLSPEVEQQGESEGFAAAVLPQPIEEDSMDTQMKMYSRNRAARPQKKL